MGRGEFSTWGGPKRWVFLAAIFGFTAVSISCTGGVDQPSQLESATASPALPTVATVKVDTVTNPTPTQISSAPDLDPPPTFDFDQTISDLDDALEILDDRSSLFAGGELPDWGTLSLNEIAAFATIEEDAEAALTRCSARLKEVTRDSITDICETLPERVDAVAPLILEWGILEDDGMCWMSAIEARFSDLS
ncbi:MAG: hypothetical protein HQ478_15260 [Chloroflexi bacterium]|nr:hypothetical protein [Chloroflexota bacterium]